MSQESLPEDNNSVSAALEEDRPNDDSAAESEQDIVLLTIVGSPKGVRKTILTLYRLGFAEVGDWSPVQRAANPKQVMSVLIRRKVSTDDKSSRKSGQ